MNELTKENYFSVEMNRYYMSASQFKAFHKCEAKAMAELSREYIREESVALLQGKMFDAYFDGSITTFVGDNTSLLCKQNGDYYAHTQAVVNAFVRVREEPEYMRLASGEQQVIMTGMIQGVPFKIMIDSLLPDECIVDRKLMAGFPDAWIDGERLPWWMAWGYDYQAAIYQYVYQQNTGIKLPFRLAAVSKEKEPDVRICEFRQDTLDNALGEIMACVERYHAIKKGDIEAEACGECDWCRRTRRITRGEYELL